MVNSARGITHCFFWKGFNSFFNTRLTIVTEIRSTIFNSISLSDSIFNSLLGLSFGGNWHSKVVRWASTRPSIFFIATSFTRFYGKHLHPFLTKLMTYSFHCFYWNATYIFQNRSVLRSMFSSLFNKIWADWTFLVLCLLF